MVNLSPADRSPTPLAVWVDADTGNEMDDIYALYRLLCEPGIDLLGMSSAHFNNADLIAFDRWNQYSTAGIDTVGISQELNEALLTAMDRQDIPHPRGADRQMGRAWGGTQPRDSEAAQGIIAAARGLGAGETLSVINLGALTNIASAIVLDPALADRVTVYLLGASWDAGTGVWNKNEFNIRNDLNAFDYLLDHPSVELVIMPVSTARPYAVEKDDTLQRLRDTVPAEKMLKDRWEETNPQDRVRILWDVALVQAVLLPHLARETTAQTHPKTVRGPCGSIPRSMWKA
jgi:inosine-uridine nucleoside N-ribohydrolase